MQDGMFRAGDRRSVRATGGVSQFAEEVVARLVARDAGGGVVLREGLVTRLTDAVRSSDAAAFDALKPELKRARISAATLADVYIPAVARRLGEAWQDDSASFAEVTMGVAKLQAILREIGAGWAANNSASDSTATLLFILPSGEQHTLGAMIASGWLRRRGISVCLRIAPSLSDLESLLAVRHFDGAMVSIACEDKLAVCEKLVKKLRDITQGRMRVAVGGAVMERGEDVLAGTGADIVTNDLAVALVAFGLTRQRITPQAAS